MLTALLGSFAATFRGIVHIARATAIDWNLLVLCGRTFRFFIFLPIVVVWALCVFPFTLPIAILCFTVPLLWLVWVAIAPFLFVVRIPFTIGFGSPRSFSELLNECWDHRPALNSTVFKDTSRAANLVLWFGLHKISDFLINGISRY